MISQIARQLDRRSDHKLWPESRVSTVLWRKNPGVFPRAQRFRLRKKNTVLTRAQGLVLRTGGFRNRIHEGTVDQLAKKIPAYSRGHRDSGSGKKTPGRSRESQGESRTGRLRPGICNARRNQCNRDQLTSFTALCCRSKLRASTASMSLLSDCLSIGWLNSTTPLNSLPP